jgi:recombination protein RecA
MASHLPNDDIFNKLLEATKTQFNKRFKDSETKFTKASEEKPPTGILVDNPLLEYILDRRFLTYGRFYLIYGQKGSCKTSLFYDIAKLFQRNGGKVIWLETENAVDLDYAKKQGVNLDDVMLIHPQTLEEALNLSEMFIRNLSKIDPDGQLPVLICLDSIAGSTTEYEQDTGNNMTDMMPGAHARLLSRFYREMEHPLANERCVFLALNQQKVSFGGYNPSGQEQISLMGGQAPMFSSTYQLRMDHGGDLKHTNEHGAERKYGSKHYVTCKRNKLGREGNLQKINFDLYINGGIDWFSPLVSKVGEEYTDIIEKRGAYYRWKLEGMTYIGKDGNETPISTEDKYYARDLGYIISNSVQAKEAIRKAFEIPDLPSEEEVAEIEAERKIKRRKRAEEKEL